MFVQVPVKTQGMFFLGDVLHMIEDMGPISVGRVVVSISVGLYLLQPC